MVGTQSGKLGHDGPSFFLISYSRFSWLFHNQGGWARMDHLSVFFHILGFHGWYTIEGGWARMDHPFAFFFILGFHGWFTIGEVRPGWTIFLFVFIF